MKHYLKQIDSYSIHKCIDDKTGYEVSVDSNNNITMNDWTTIYVFLYIIGKLKDGYVEATKEEFESAYIAGVEKLNKITSNL